MRFPWQKADTDQQLDLLGDASKPERPAPALRARAKASPLPGVGAPRTVPTSQIEEDPNNPRTEFPDAELDELADDVRQRGILQPLVVHPADAQGRYRLHFGAKRLRAALRAGLSEVPVVVREAPADAYDQVAENLKRHALTPPDLARFIKRRVDAGESNAEIARRLGMNLTAVAHHLSLLDLPPALDQALKAGRCTSPRTLHELSKLNEVEPDKVRALVESGAEMTREAVAELKADSAAAAAKPKVGLQTEALARAHTACDRLERALERISGLHACSDALPELLALRTRLEGMGCKWPWGSDRQTPGSGAS
jgi:ParB family transcriptional regulator, chromosome partitioning protein